MALIAPTTTEADKLMMVGYDAAMMWLNKQPDQSQQPQQNAAASSSSSS